MTLAVAMSDADARDRIRSVLHETLIVEAAAGTGKTTELVRRILRVLETGTASMSGIVAVTFTEKAAGELKLRLREELERARTAASDARARARLDAAVAQLEEAHVSTIHGFCADLLREHPVEACIDPLFTVLTEAQSRRYFDEAFDRWLQEALDASLDGVRRSLRRSTRPSRGGDADEGGPVERLRRAGWDLAEWRDFRAAWTRPAWNRVAAIAALAGRVETFATLTANAASGRDPLFVDTAPARYAARELAALLASADHDTAEAVLVELRRNRDFRRARTGRGAAFGTDVSRSAVQAAHQQLLGELDAFAADADADLAARLREELRGCIDRYEALKARAGALDFLDLLLLARNLLRDRDDVRREFQQRFACIFVDEFQDTDPLQAEILLLLAADDPGQREWTHVRPVPGKLFIVGDPKQSIYRFRRADVAIYQRVCRQLCAAGAVPLRLTTSFRAVPHLQRAVNRAFAPLMTGSDATGQAHYVPLAPWRPQPDDQPSLVALPVPEPYGRRRIAAEAIERSLPDAVGAFLEWLLHESGWRVSDRDGRRVPVQARHVCILFRRFVSYRTDMTRAYVDALEARGIRHLLVGGRGFHDREELETIRAALAAVEWPDDELAVFATLRGALFAIGDEELLEYRHLPDVRAFHPFRVAGEVPEHLDPIRDALRLLADLHVHRNRRPVAETLTRLLDATRAHVGFALRRAGEQVLANVLHVAELARRYEIDGGISFRGFVDELRRAADEGQAAEAPIVEDGSDGVRLMTVHKAKGLEFPVVILADLTAKLAPAEASRYLDPERALCALRIGGWSPHDLLVHQALEHEREREEGVRVGYVAATRARDLLVVPAVGDQPYVGGWTMPLDAAIYPAVADRRRSDPAPGCPTFRKDSVLRRPDEEIASMATVCPGIHHFAGAVAGEEFDVVWWDPAALRLGVDPPVGLRRQELISKDVEGSIVVAEHRRYIDWRDSRDRAMASGRAPSIHVRTATEWAAGTAGTASVDAQHVEIVAVDTDAPRPSGRRYGTLVHAAVATVPLDAHAAVIDRVVATQGRIVGATDSEVAAARRVVAAVLMHSLFEQARHAEAAGRCLRETPVTILVDGVLVEGIVDFAFDDGPGVTVVDFKTDRADGELLERYRRQVALYAAAIGRATGRPARPVLMHL